MIGQILHILRKDIQRLRWEIAAVALATIAMGWINGDNRLWLRSFDDAEDLQRLVAIFAALQVAALAGWILLAVQLVHGEVMPGVRQFWLTRPYERGALLAAKLLFAALFLQAPVLIGDVLTLIRSGAGVEGQWGALLWRQALHFLIAVAPPMALALVTTGLAQVALAGVGAALVASLLPMLLLGGTHGLVAQPGLGWWPWIVTVALAWCGTALLFWRLYFRREHRVGIAILCAAVMAAFLIRRPVNLSTSFALQQRAARQPGAASALQLRSDLARGRYVETDPLRLQRQWNWSQPIRLPVAFVNQHPLELRPEFVELSATDAASGAVVPLPRAAAGLAWPDGRSWLGIQLRPADYERVRARALRLEARVALTVFGNPRTARIPYRAALGSVQPVRPFGVCATPRPDPTQVLVLCREPFGPRHFLRATLVDRDSGARHRQPAWIQPGAGYGPLHMDAGVSALTIFSAGFRLVPTRAGEAPPWDAARLGQTDIELTAFEPLDHVWRSVRFDRIKLEDYVVEPPATPAVARTADAGFADSAGASR